ncbi:hypothetical protein [Parasulfitobacter algicola]|uniref:Uncharacterized protein n=1 Tax=Parasulfitobacter algicola TaxID=2614809 RepID=A0ABX2IZP6_9RHOB|nr:hypothetical protein [Sulfitobacter algicola]NSX56905.1 hypothetical protein [Sulfitobacter algicola]
MLKSVLKSISALLLLMWFVTRPLSADLLQNGDAISSIQIRKQLDQGNCSEIWEKLYSDAKVGSKHASAWLAVLLYTDITPPNIEEDNDFHVTSIYFFTVNAVGERFADLPDFESFEDQVIYELFLNIEGKSTCQTAKNSSVCMSEAHKHGLLPTRSEYIDRIDEIESGGGVASCMKVN